MWSQKEYPLIPVGKMVLNLNPKNYFAEVEQIAFSPAHLIPGIEASPDKMLQVITDFMLWMSHLVWVPKSNYVSEKPESVGVVYCPCGFYAFNLHPQLVVIGRVTCQLVYSQLVFYPFHLIAQPRVSGLGGIISKPTQTQLPW